MTVPAIPPRFGAAARVACVTATVETSQPLRLTFTLARISLQTFLVACLWRALYAQTTTSSGLTEKQAVGYAVLAVLLGARGGIDRTSARDTLPQQVRDGTILYWFIRPMAARRYYAVRALGDQGYAMLWFVAGVGVGRALGLVDRPPSAAAGLTALASLLLGQITLYYLTLTMDLVCFWAIKNSMAIVVFQFVQNLLAGVFAPLWFFPAWFRAVDGWLPFQGIVNVPLSLYLGRIPATQAWTWLAAQAAWCAALSVLTARLWRRAGRRVSVQGG
jgi:ABC-2 type transport system permease protein